jgi:hypothetical protein
MRCERVSDSPEEGVEEDEVVDWKRRVGLVRREDDKGVRGLGLRELEGVVDLLCCLERHCCGRIKLRELISRTACRAWRGRD